MSNYVRHSNILVRGLSTFGFVKCFKSPPGVASILSSVRGQRRVQKCYCSPLSCSSRSISSQIHQAREAKRRNSNGSEGKHERSYSAHLKYSTPFRTSYKKVAHNQGRKHQVVPLSGSSGGDEERTISSYTKAGGKDTTIAAGEPFAGRSEEEEEVSALDLLYQVCF